MPRERDDSAGRLLVVSNRLPLTLRAAARSWRVERSSGGLATAVGPILARTGGLWVGWPGDAPAGAGSAARTAAGAVGAATTAT